MSLTNIKSKIQSERGFTIVELLIVVVVIAILAAITIVSYNGITRSANESAAKQQASTVAKKIESYQAKEGRYPVNFTELNSSAESYHLTSGVNTATSGTHSGAFVQQVTTALTADTGKTTVIVRKCAAATPTPNTQAGVVIGNITGVEIYFWDYATGALTTTPTRLGVTTACPTAQ